MASGLADLTFLSSLIVLALDQTERRPTEGCGDIAHSLQIQSESLRRRHVATRSGTALA